MQRHNQKVSPIALWRASRNKATTVAAAATIDEEEKKRSEDPLWVDEKTDFALLCQLETEAKARRTWICGFKNRFTGKICVENRVNDKHSTNLRSCCHCGSTRQPDVTDSDRKYTFDSRQFKVQSHKNMDIMNMKLYGVSSLDSATSPSSATFAIGSNSPLKPALEPASPSFQSILTRLPSGLSTPTTTHTTTMTITTTTLQQHHPDPVAVDHPSPFKNNPLDSKKKRKRSSPKKPKETKKKVVVVKEEPALPTTTSPPPSPSQQTKITSKPKTKTKAKPKAKPKTKANRTKPTIQFSDFIADLQTRIEYINKNQHYVTSTLSCSPEYTKAFQSLLQETSKLSSSDLLLPSNSSVTLATTTITKQPAPLPSLTTPLPSAPIPALVKTEKKKVTRKRKVTASSHAPTKKKAAISSMEKGGGGGKRTRPAPIHVSDGVPSEPPIAAKPVTRKRTPPARKVKRDKKIQSTFQTYEAFCIANHRPYQHQWTHHDQVMTKIHFRRDLVQSVQTTKPFVHVVNEKISSLPLAVDKGKELIHSLFDKITTLFENDNAKKRQYTMILNSLRSHSLEYWSLFMEYYYYSKTGQHVSITNVPKTEEDDDVEEETESEEDEEEEEEQKGKKTGRKSHSKRQQQPKNKGKKTVTQRSKQQQQQQQIKREVSFRSLDVWMVIYVVFLHVGIPFQEVEFFDLFCLEFREKARQTVWRSVYRVFGMAFEHGKQVDHCPAFLEQYDCIKKMRLSKLQHEKVFFPFYLFDYTELSYGYLYVVLDSIMKVDPNLDQKCILDTITYYHGMIISSSYYSTKKLMSGYHRKKLMKQSPSSPQPGSPPSSSSSESISATEIKEYCKKISPKTQNSRYMIRAWLWFSIVCFQIAFMYNDHMDFSLDHILNKYIGGVRLEAIYDEAKEIESYFNQIQHISPADRARLFCQHPRWKLFNDTHRKPKKDPPQQVLAEVLAEPEPVVLALPEPEPPVLEEEVQVKKEPAVVEEEGLGDFFD